MDGDASTASASRPSAHTQRYDRQLRLWASSGQASLESAKILVLGASHLGACVLKNLILPGIGSFTLVDGSNITHFDLGNNFFIASDAKGKSRALEVCKNLCELNPSVKGQAIQDDPAEFVKDKSLEDFTLVIAVNQPQRVLFPLAQTLWTAKKGTGIPLMALRAAGFIGEVQVQFKEAAIIDTHPETIVDMRLIRPWPALQSYAESYKVEEIDSMQHSHIPFLVILLRKLQEWKQSHGGDLPKPSVDRKAFRELINTFRQTDNADAENVDEALGALGQHVWRPIAAGNSGKVPTEIAALFKDEACNNITPTSSNFWLLVRALREFVKQGDGTLPLPGSLPDMKALSATYVQLQLIFRQKAAEDLSNLKRLLDDLLDHVGLPHDAISSDEIESFAKHASFLKLIRGRMIQDSTNSKYSESMRAACQDPINPEIFQQHIALLTCEKFFELQKARYPGCSAAMTESLIGGKAYTAQEDSLETSSSIVDKVDGSDPGFNFEEDLSVMVQIVEELMVQMNLPSSAEGVVEACQEITRSGHADLPSTAALLGGMAAQEAIKIVTKQYIPINNTAVYDGIKQAIGVFAL